MQSKLQMYLKERGISSYRLQKDTGLAYSTIYRLMKFDNVGTIDTWQRIADALRCTIDDIVNYKEESDG